MKNSPATRAVLTVLCTFAFAQQHHIREQPIPFSHKQHVSLGLTCKDCHANPGALETLPATSKCMACHVSTATDSPAIKKLKAFADAQQPIPWARVYQVPDFVRFSHRAHLKGGFKCEKCHGPVATRDALWKETDLSMTGCIACHRQSRASVACTYCHENLQ